MTRVRAHHCSEVAQRAVERLKEDLCVGRCEYERWPQPDRRLATAARPDATRLQPPHERAARRLATGRVEGAEGADPTRVGELVGVRRLQRLEARSERRARPPRLF